jgi:hypothetical protein
MTCLPACQPSLPLPDCSDIVLCRNSHQYVHCPTCQLCAQGSTQVTHGRSQQGCQSQWQGCGASPLPFPGVDICLLCCLQVRCVQLHGGMLPVPAQQTIGRVKARHLHVTVSPGLGAPMLFSTCFAHTCAHSYAATGTSAYSDLYTQHMCSASTPSHTSYHGPLLCMLCVPPTLTDLAGHCEARQPREPVNFPLC